MRILAIDPGSERSAWVQWDGELAGAQIEPNDAMLQWLRNLHGVDVVVIEKMESYGRKVGREVFDTCVWSGRFAEACHPIQVVFLPRRTPAFHICHNQHATDAMIRAALIERWGGKEAAIGTAANPGPLHDIVRDLWLALAHAVTWSELPIQTTLPEPSDESVRT